LLARRAVRKFVVVSRYLAGAGLAGGLASGAGAGRAGAAPVVVPGSEFDRGVTSRIPVGAAGGEVRSVFWAVEVGGDVPAWFTLELFSP
jgi:hypothetical protein